MWRRRSGHAKPPLFRRRRARLGSPCRRRASPSTSLPVAVRVHAWLLSRCTRGVDRCCLAGLRRCLGLVGASSAAAAPCALLHCQTLPPGPQGSSVRHGVPGRVQTSAREAMPAPANAAGPRRRPIHDGAPCVAAAPLLLPSARLVCGDILPRPSAWGADPCGCPAATAATSSRGRPVGRVAHPGRRASAPPSLRAACSRRHNPVVVRAGR